jgi:hypothetical protein
MVQGLYAENLRHLANYGIPQSFDPATIEVSASPPRSQIDPQLR